VVIENRATWPVIFRLLGTEGATLDGQLAPGQLASLNVTGRVEVAFRSAGKVQRYRLDPNRAYVFVPGGAAATRAVALRTVPLLPDPAGGHADLGVDPIADGRPLGPLPPREVTVKLLVDDDEPAVRRLWEPRLRRRLAEASAIFKRYCNVTFKVTQIDTWDSDDRQHDFPKSLAEFEREVDPGQTMLAIGFTSQYRVPRGRTHLGGTRGPLHPWILIREWSQHVTPAERLELLVHELGHYLGAAHSDERFSVMRPKMTGSRANDRRFQIRFDALNTLAMCMMAGQLPHNRPQSGRERRIERDVAANLRSIYATLAKKMPDDPAARDLLSLLSRPNPPAAEAGPETDRRQ